VFDWKRSRRERFRGDLGSKGRDRSGERGTRGAYREKVESKKGRDWKKERLRSGVRGGERSPQKEFKRKKESLKKRRKESFSRAAPL